MNQGINILYLEDDPADAVRVENKLRESGLIFDLRRADTREAFLSGLELAPDVILSDHGLPTFDGLAAFGMARQKCPQVPFIFVTNALTREMEIEKLMGGVADYVRKNELDYLPVAMRHALREAKEEQLRKQRVKEFLKQHSVEDTIMLPICSNCKKIRNKQNQWQPLEIYFWRTLKSNLPTASAGNALPNSFRRCKNAKVDDFEQTRELNSA